MADGREQVKGVAEEEIVLHKQKAFLPVTGQGSLAPTPSVRGGDSHRRAPKVPGADDSVRRTQQRYQTSTDQKGLGLATRPFEGVVGPGLLNSLKGALAAAGQAVSPAQVLVELAATGLASVLGRIEPAMLQADRSSGPTFIVPVDQAEELFASDGQDEAQQFLAHTNALREHLARTGPLAAGVGRLQVLFVLTIRSDSLPKLQAQAALQALSPVLFSLPAMPVSEFKAVIEGPAERHTATVKPLVIAPQLIEQLVVDAQGADALPLLALTLEWLYREFTNAQGTRVGYDEYQRLDGVRGVIGEAVKHAFEKPGDEPAIPAQKQEQDRLLQQLFPFLATVDPDTGESKRLVALREDIREKAAPSRCDGVAAGPKALSRLK